MATITLQLRQTSITNILIILIALISSILLFTTKLNSTWLLFAGAAIGLISGFLAIG